jgi:hypothetical protein
LVLGVVTPGKLGVDLAEVHRHDAQASTLEPPNDLADEPAFDGIRLAQDEGSALRGGRL